MSERLYGLAVCLMCNSQFDQLMTVRNNKRKCKKAGVWDLLTREHINHAVLGLMKILTSIFNAIIKILHVPKDFKCGMRIPIYNGGGKDSKLRENHRGITLLLH